MKDKVRAFPLHDYVWLRDRCNHADAVNQMSSHNREDWRIVFDEDDTQWIEANIGTAAETTLRALVEAEKKYPLLNERGYYEEESKYVHDAIRRLCKRTGTIIDSERDLIQLLYDSDIEIIEDEPCKFIVLIGDEHFKQLTKELTA